jgi:cysteine desulfurase/selenocysteine lyase
VLSSRRTDFPGLTQQVRGKPLVYLDNASTTPRPQVVLDATLRMLGHEHANVHRGVHALSEMATASFEAARAEIARFLGAEPDEIVFTRGTTESVNLVAQSWGRAHLRPGDVVVATQLEHHSNLVPWQLLCREKGAELRLLPVDDLGRLTLEPLPPRTRLVTASHASNVLGIRNPVETLTEAAHAAGALLFVDGAQAVAHFSVDVRTLGADFYAFSGHKMFGPTGIGVLWARAELLADMPPWHGGGEMVLSVRETDATFRDGPRRFEAGTPDIAGAVGLGAAAAYLRALGAPSIAAAEEPLRLRLVDTIGSIAGVRLLANPDLPLVSFTLDGVHPHDVATIVDREGIAIRSGHHCAQPLHTRLGLDASVRASLAFYNTAEEIDALGRALELVVRTFR